MKIALVILAAGQGTRMNSELPKVLHSVADAPLLAHALRSGLALSPDKVVIVAGFGADLVAAAAKEHCEDADVVVQNEQLGTAHAVAQARSALQGFDGDIIVMFGDTPFVRPETLDSMIKARAGHNIVVLGFEAADPGRYGRLVLSDDNLERIVEFRDATPAEQDIRLCNSGVLACDAATLFDLIDAVESQNAAKEYYLTDIVAIARSKGLSATVVTCAEAETLGVNTRAQLAQADAAFQIHARTTLMENGVTLTAPETVYLAYDTVIGRDTVLEPNIVFGPGVTVESGARIRAFSHLEGCHVSRGAVIGPYARLRPGAELAENTRVGNFVEVKNARIDEGAKVNHLSYVGDAHVGKRTNIGAGTITCNYDGVMKHHTEIGQNVFVGSNTMFVAPVAIGDNAMTGSGSVITKDVAEGELALARAAQVNKPGLATKIMEILKSKKNKKLN